MICECAHSDDDHAYRGTGFCLLDCECIIFRKRPPSKGPKIDGRIVPEDKKRNKVIGAQVTTAEWQSVRDQAEADGVTVSDLIRSKFFAPDEP